ncbi:MAG: RICIN domain-containing protein [Chitinophagaceae bacterium]
MKTTFLKILFVTAIILVSNTLLFSQINSMRQNTSVQTVTTQQSSQIKEGIYYIKIIENNKYLGIEGNSNSNGAKLIQWDFANQNNHKFYISRTADGYYLIKAMHSNKFLNVAEQSTKDGAIICQWDFVNQDNLKWFFFYNKVANTYIIKNKQSNKQLQLQTNLFDTNNGTSLSINGSAKAQTFLLQDVNMINTNVNTITKRQDGVISNLTNTIQVRMSDGSIINRTINPKNIVNNKTTKKILQSQGDGECVTNTARIDMNTQGNVPVTASTYLEYNAPGLIYDMRRFYGGDYTNKQEFPNGENRNPIEISTTVRNMVGSITEAVAQPTKKWINQGIKNLQDRYTMDRLQTTSQSLIYRSSYVESNTEMQLKLGASAHYMGSSFSANMKITDAKQTKTFFIEAEKELFSISVDKPENGFFNTEVPGIENLGYISNVSYGVKIIGKIEVDNSEESLDSDFKLMINGGFAGGGFDFASFSRRSHKNIKCFFLCCRRYE